MLEDGTLKLLQNSSQYTNGSNIRPPYIIELCPLRARTYFDYMGSYLYEFKHTHWIRSVSYKSACIHTENDFIKSC